MYCFLKNWAPQIKLYKIWLITALPRVGCAHPGWLTQCTVHHYHVGPWGKILVHSLFTTCKVSVIYFRETNCMHSSCVYLKFLSRIMSRFKLSNKWYLILDNRWKVWGKSMELRMWHFQNTLVYHESEAWMKHSGLHWVWQESIITLTYGSKNCFLRTAWILPVKKWF